MSEKLKVAFTAWQSGENALEFRRGADYMEIENIPLSTVQLDMLLEILGGCCFNKVEEVVCVKS